MTKKDETSFEDRRSFKDCRHAYASTANNCLVRIEDLVRQHYWGGRCFEVREAKVTSSGVELGSWRWEEEDIHLTPAFPDQPHWEQGVECLRAEKIARHLDQSSVSASLVHRSRRV